MPAATSAAAFCGFIRCSLTPSVVMTTMIGSPVADRTANERASTFETALRKNAHVGSPRVNRKMTVNMGTSNRTLGTVDERVEIEVDAALNEEDRDEEAEADRLEFARDRLAVLSPDEQAHDDAGREGTEQNIEAELLGQVDEQDHKQDRDPHRQLCRRVEVSAHQSDETRRVHLRGEERSDHGDPDEEGEEEERDPGITVREQDRHRDDRAELTDGTHGQDRGSDRRAQHAGVTEDRQQRAERRRGQAQGDHNRVEHKSRGMEEGAHPQREDERGAPRARRPSEMALTHRRQIELGPGKEHQIGQAKFRQRRHDVVRVRQIEHVGTEDDPEQNLDHDLGYGDEPPGPFGDEGREDRRQSDEHQGRDGAVDHRSPARLVTARCGTPRHLPGPRYAFEPCIRVISKV